MAISCKRETQTTLIPPGGKTFFTGGKKPLFLKKMMGNPASLGKKTGKHGRQKNKKGRGTFCPKEMAGRKKIRRQGGGELGRTTEGTMDTGVEKREGSPPFGAGMAPSNAKGGSLEGATENGIKKSWGTTHIKTSAGRYSAAWGATAILSSGAETPQGATSPPRNEEKNHRNPWGKEDNQADCPTASVPGISLDLNVRRGRGAPILKQGKKLWLKWEPRNKRTRAAKSVLSGGGAKKEGHKNNKGVGAGGEQPGIGGERTMVRRTCIL